VRLREEALNRAMEKDWSAAITAAETLLKHAEEEGITAHMADFYEVPAKLYFNVGDLGEAERYIRLALEDTERYGVHGDAGQEKVNSYRGLLAEILRRRKAAGL
jgi:hypothetical protein